MASVSVCCPSCSATEGVMRTQHDFTSAT
ncbi:IS1 family transposase [Klebsiella pneumoniae]